VQTIVRVSALLTTAVALAAGCGGAAAAGRDDAGLPADAAAARDGAIGPDGGHDDAGAGPDGAGPINLCQGLVQDRLAHPMTALAKPALGGTVVDPEFGTTIRRITAVAATGSDPVIKPLYSPTAAWNADESRLLLYHVGVGHEIYDGRSYAFVKSVAIAPADLEQVWWDAEDPDVFYYVDGTDFIRYHVGAGTREVHRTFDFCSGGAAADSHAFTSWGSTAVGLKCDQTVFVYRIQTDEVVTRTTSGKGPPFMGADGQLVYWEGQVADLGLSVQRTLDLANPFEHSCLGMLPNGHDTYNASNYDPGPAGSAVGTLVTFDMTDGTSWPVIGPATGYPYPPSASHISAIVFRQPGWAWVSIVGDPAGAGVLDSELVLADTASGAVCRVAHHRSFGKNNTHLATPYFAEPHVTASRRGTRAVFASDWGNGTTVDTYVVELPSYAP
jgi:hypothetical protein